MSGTTRHTLQGLALLSALTLPLAACADDPATGSAASTAESVPSDGPLIDVTMRDIAFDAPTIEVEAGVPVTFHFENTGAARHDAFIGDSAAQAEHETEMAAMASTDGSMPGHDMGDMGATGGTDGPDMDGMHHGDGNALSLAPGGHGMLTHTFDEPGTYEIGCHQPGHYAAGMHVEITVV